MRFFPLLLRRSSLAEANLAFSSSVGGPLSALTPPFPHTTPPPLQPRLSRPASSMATKFGCDGTDCPCHSQEKSRPPAAPITTGPVKITLGPGEAKYICTCGESKNYPFCDVSCAGAHAARVVEFPASLRSEGSNRKESGPPPHRSHRARTRAPRLRRPPASSRARSRTRAPSRRTST